MSYDAKWSPETEDFRSLVPEVELSLVPSIRENILRQSTSAALALGCRGYFRVDLRERNGELFVLDVNPNPDINVDSGFARQAAAAGYAYEDIVEIILKEAFYGNSRKL